MSRHDRPERRKAAPQHDPRFLNAIWPLNHPAPSRDMLFFLWGALSSSHYTDVEYVGGGEKFLCFYNVASHIQAHGGEAVVGWAIQPGGHPRNPNRNRFARLWVESHCVWMSPEGGLVDVTSGYEHARFIHNPWGLLSNISCVFLDRLALSPSTSGSMASYFGQITVDSKGCPEFVPKSMKAIHGQLLAQSIIGWRFTSDSYKALRVRDSLTRLAHPLPVTASST